MLHDVAEVVFWAESLSDLSDASDKAEVERRLSILEDRCRRLVSRCRAAAKELYEDHS